MLTVHKTTLLQIYQTNNAPNLANLGVLINNKAFCIVERLITQLYHRLGIELSRIN
jgi:hypothetical protein